MALLRAGGFVVGTNSASPNPCLSCPGVVSRDDGGQMKRQRQPAGMSGEHHGEQHEEWMRRALELAARSPEVDPNPRVGCVLVDDAGLVRGEGWHTGAGTPHAEVEALHAAGSNAAGTTAYVSLEPCNHHGRTGPCVQALLRAGVRRVVYAQADPNPRAAGGAASLAANGVDVIGGILGGEATALNRTWTFSAIHGRPFVTWKVAATLDGRTAAADGTSAWITGAAARADVHQLRARCGAILIGTGTALVDDPQLTVRGPDATLAPKQPLRVVIGRRPIPANARVLSPEAATLLLNANPDAVLARLHEQGIHRALLEGGATLAAAFLTAGLIDEIVAYIAPALLGSGAPMIGDLGVTSMAGIHRYALAGVTRLGDDVRLTLRPLSDASRTSQINPSKE